MKIVAKISSYEMDCTGYELFGPYSQNEANRKQAEIVENAKHIIIPVITSKIFDFDDLPLSEQIDNLPERIGSNMIEKQKFIRAIIVASQSDRSALKKNMDANDIDDHLSNMVFQEFFSGWYGGQSENDETKQIKIFIDYVFRNSVRGEDINLFFKDLRECGLLE